MMHVVRSYLCDQWQEGGERRPLVNPTTDELMAEAGSGGLDLGAALQHARTKGGEALRAMTFAERGKLLAAIASSIHERREELVALAIANGGNTRGDAKFDVDGATGTLSYYAKLGERLGDVRARVDGKSTRLARNPRYVGHHVFVPRRGVAVHINAFNFPAWGLFEKAAVSLLAGVPVFAKPATATALVAEKAVSYLVEDGVLPSGVLSLLCGSAGDLLDHMDGQDVLAFTGSADTGARLRGHAAVVERSVRLNIEADSLNAAVLGADVDGDSDTFDLFLREVARDVTQKAGQKCTAIRRVLVPEGLVDEVRERLAEEVDMVRVGNPALREVRMGPLTNAAQLTDTLEGMAALEEAGAERFHGGGRGDLVDVEGDKGCFVRPSLFLASADNPVVHAREVFGPCATILPYDGSPESAVDIVSRGKGSLVSSIYTDDRGFAEGAVMGCAAYLGRVHLGSSRVAEHSPGPGTVLPQMVHGGPGRAGGGEELGGERGLGFYSQRTAIQGEATLLEKFLPLQARESEKESKKT
jgi:oxepin-CoA hydrolase/3-oxo-5,6-dehydrosuberyl-CoA semialdehyde dehydrogenase